MVSPLGRIRHLPLIDSTDGFTRSKEERRAINSPIQSTLSDLCAWSIVKIEEALGEEACVVGMTHDSCYGYVREDQAKEIVPQIGQIMVELPYTRDFGWEPALTFPTDAEAGPNMAAMVKLK